MPDLDQYRNLRPGWEKRKPGCVNQGSQLLLRLYKLEAWPSWVYWSRNSATTPPCSHGNTHSKARIHLWVSIIHRICTYTAQIKPTKTSPPANPRQPGLFPVSPSLTHPGNIIIILFCSPISPKGRVSPEQGPLLIQ